jgi:hypothetical protein
MTRLRSRRLHRLRATADQMAAQLRREHAADICRIGRFGPRLDAHDAILARSVCCLVAAQQELAAMEEQESEVA